MDHRGAVVGLPIGVFQLLLRQTVNYSRLLYRSRFRHYLDRWLEHTFVLQNTQVRTTTLSGRFMRSS